MSERFSAVMYIILTLLMIFKKLYFFLVFLSGENMENYFHLTVNPSQSNPNFCRQIIAEWLNSSGSSSLMDNLSYAFPPADIDGGLILKWFRAPDDEETVDFIIMLSFDALCLWMPSVSCQMSINGLLCHYPVGQQA